MPARADYRAIAFDIINRKSFRKGQVRLASGKMSDYYLDMKPTMFDPVGALALAHLVLERLRAAKVDAVGGLEMGAVPLISNVAMLSAMPTADGAAGGTVHGFFVRKSVKDHGTQKLLEGYADLAEVAGKQVAVLDDVTTTGESAMVAVRAAQKAGARVVMALSVVDRLEGATETYAKANIPFTSIFTSDHFMKA